MIKSITYIVLIMLLWILFSCTENNTNNSNQNFVEMLPVPIGIFEMGNSMGDPSEMPVHIVKITKEFYIGKYEITQKQFKAVMGYNPSKNSSNENNPVENINWIDAFQFCNELSAINSFDPCYSLINDTVWVCDFAKNGYRLPTEAEWEYACRAGTTKDYCGGTEVSDLDKIGWYKTNSDKSTHSVGLKQPNLYGLFDILGNVSEMVWDFFSHYEKGIIENPAGPDSGIYRMVRGGSWNGDSRYCRTSSRMSSAMENKSNDIGFRVVRTK
jgi:formylglycine-generating enzyme required for sulfatase activity